MIDLSMLDEEKLKELEVAHREGFQAGIRGEQGNCPYQPDSAEIIFWDKGLEDGKAFALEVSRRV